MAEVPETIETTFAGLIRELSTKPTRVELELTNGQRLEGKIAGSGDEWLMLRLEDRTIWNIAIAHVVRVRQILPPPPAR